MASTVLIYHSLYSGEYLTALRPLLPDVRLIPCATPSDAATHIQEADVLFCRQFPAELYAQAGALKWVQSMNAGIDDLVRAPLPADCVLTRVEGLFGEYMSEYAFAHMLAHVQKLPWFYRNQAAGEWAPARVAKLAGRRLGVAGVGSIGAEVARKGKAFGMEVWALSRSPRQMNSVDQVFGPDRVEEFTAGVDYLVSSLPLTPETVGLINPRQMKSGAVLINVGRGATIDEPALLETVQAGRIQAVLDVFAREPLAPDHPFWKTPGITVTPHISGPSVPSEVAEYFAQNFRRYEAGEPLLGLVDRARGY